MAQNEFQAYLERRQPFGDTVDKPFVDGAISDPELPDPASWEELEAYIKQRNTQVSDDTLKAAKHVWQLYLEER